MDGWIDGLIDCTVWGTKTVFLQTKSLFQVSVLYVQVNQWCESGIYLLASQAVDKCQSQDGAESALTDLEQFMDSAPKNQLTELRNLHNQYEVVLSEDLKVLSPSTMDKRMTEQCALRVVMHSRPLCAGRCHEGPESS